MTINATQHTPDHQIARELDRLLQPQQTAPREIQARAWFSPHDGLHKYAIFDRNLLLNGSCHWTRGAAEHNEENFMVLNYQPLVMRYLEQFEILWNKLACFENC
ncbi:MAG: phospholipase D-like domain-containing protein [Planctomyces sp.]